MGRSSNLLLFLAVPLLCSPQDIPAVSHRRPFGICSMAYEPHLRCPLAEECNRAILSHRGREWADIHTPASFLFICLHQTSYPTCGLCAILHGFVEYQIIFPFILPKSRQVYTKTNDTLVLCPRIYDCYILCMLRNDRLQMLGGIRRSRYTVS